MEKEQSGKETVTPSVEQTQLALQGEDIKGALAKMNTATKLSFLRKVSEYVGADTEDTNKYLNVPINVVGILIHEATINRGNTSHMDPVTGEIVETPNYTNQNRTVLKLEGGKVLGFVSISIENYVREWLIPSFGMGDWMEDGKQIVVPMKIQQVTTKGGRAYSIQII